MARNKRCFLCAITDKSVKLMKDLDHHWCGASMAMNGLKEAGYDCLAMLCEDCNSLTDVLKKNPCAECK